MHHKLLEFIMVQLVTTNAGLSGMTASIVAFARADGSGSTNALTSFLNAGTTGAFEPVGNGTFPLYPPGGVATSNTGLGNNNESGALIGSGAMATAVNTTSYSIGYVGFDFLTQSSTYPNISISYIENSCGTYLQPSIASIQAAAVGVTVPSNLLVDFINTPNCDGYPIANVTNVVVLSCQPKCCLVYNLQNFLYYLATTGQFSANSLGFGQLPASVVSAYITQLYSITANCF
jgi:phosphate transport system substrate-binding protein